MTCYFGHMESAVSAPDESLVKKTINWNKLKHPTDFSNCPEECASREFKLYETYNNIKYLPVMEPLKVLGAFDKDFQPKEPTYVIGHWTSKD